MWTTTDIPGQQGRVAVVTGANTGIGFETAALLAQRGATVVLACRDTEKAASAARQITGLVPEAETAVVRADLASLASVRAAAEEIRARYEKIDLLVNNAGVNGVPGRTEDGFEMQFGVNHLGHFALTGLLLDRMLPVPGSRIVAVSSLTHRFSRMRLADLDSGGNAYARSKLANLMFAYELQRRLAAAGAATVALAAHPGGAGTGIFRHWGWFSNVATVALTGLLGRTPAQGALPIVRAAVDPQAQGGEYYGPGGLLEIGGAPKRVGSTAHSRDVAAQAELWRESERRTGVEYPL